MPCDETEFKTLISERPPIYHGQCWRQVNFPNLLIIVLACPPIDRRMFTLCHLEPTHGGGLTLEVPVAGDTIKYQYTEEELLPALGKWGFEPHGLEARVVIVDEDIRINGIKHYCK